MQIERGRPTSFFFLKAAKTQTMSYSTGGSSRGDLGFIPNARYPHPNRSFGQPATLSKKNVALYSQTTRANLEKPPTGELTADHMVTKRTEYLETQERRMTATINEHRSHTQQMAEQLAASLGSLECLQGATKRVESEQEKITQRTKQLAQDQHWVYGKTSRVLKGIDGQDKPQAALATYRKQKGVVEKLVDLSPTHKWVLLSYPMEKVDTASGYQFLMRVKLVEPRTGQITMHWAIVFEEVNGEQHYAIEEFSTWPH